MKPVKLIIIGAGSRGTCYSKFALQFPERAKIVAVAEPRDLQRDSFVNAHNISDHNTFRDWREVLKHSKFADAVIISTQDNLHVEPALAFIKKGYNILLEKPMATNEHDCQRIVASALQHNIVFAVCHVLRYTKYTQTLKQIINSGDIGDIVSVQHLEPVGFWHQAHSYVRGNWRKESESSPMILAKSCHDLDWLIYIIGSSCIKVSSFGNLKHFRKENKPSNAAKRCVDCACEKQCPYSAINIYRYRAQKGQFGWPIDVITHNLTIEGVDDAIRTGPYGLCVYDCDNDVVDHQVVNMLFANNCTANFTMTAFNRGGDRMTRVFGTKGELYGNGSIIEHYDFRSDTTKTISVTILMNDGFHPLPQPTMAR